MCNIELQRRIRTELRQCKNIVLYGTGYWAEYIFPYFEKYQMISQIYAVVDKDDSPMVGTEFHGYKIKKLSDVLAWTDSIVIASRDYWQIISERVHNMLEERGIQLPVIEVFNNDEKKIRNNEIEDYKEYVLYLEERQLNRKKKEKFVEITDVPYKFSDRDTKIIAWYLPQYQTEVNNEYYGGGFTERTSFLRAIPFFVGHEQPHIPCDMRCYDINNIDALRWQVKLAKMYGIYGFCFHYYWFSGKGVIEKLLYLLLEHKDINIPFCFNWTTENWGSICDGGQYDFIFEEKFMKDIIPFFKDSRYIKIHEKPLLVIHVTKIFQRERFLKLIKRFRNIVQNDGFSNLFILLTSYDDFNFDISEWGADGVVEFPLAGMNEWPLYEPEGYINSYFNGKIFDLNRYISERKYMKHYCNKRIFRSALVSFDNTSGNPGNKGIICHGGTPENYQKWVVDLVRDSKSTHCREEDIIFVNAWNGWEDGAHLEPDVTNGYAYLEATKGALYKSREINVTYVDNKIRSILKEKLIPRFYILCVESMGDVIACEPIARKLKKHVPNSWVTWIVKWEYSEIVKYNPFVNDVFGVSCLGEASDFCDSLKGRNNVVINCHFNGRKCVKTNRIHKNYINPMINGSTYYNYGALLESFSLTAGMQKISDAPLFHENVEAKNPIKDGNKYIVFHCKSSEKCRDWQSEKWNELACKMMKVGYTVVEIGLEPVVSNTSQKFIDCTRIRDIQIIAQIIKDAELFIGGDSGFAHLANCYKKNAVLLLGKYKNFDKPMPYTGYYAIQKDNTILYAREGSVESLCVDEVYNRALEKLLC